jgi:8-oxo-dGTP diphosphatase
MSHRIRVSSRAIVIHDGRILLNCFGEGLYYNFPGGGIEAGETALEAVVREVREESGLDVAAQEHLFTFEYEPRHCGGADGDVHHISVFFRCGLTGSPELRAPSVPDVNPDDPAITSHAEWVPVGELTRTPFVPRCILRSLLTYIETGVFAPGFVEAEQ